jgi:hypothetical protein
MTSWNPKIMLHLAYFFTVHDDCAVRLRNPRRIRIYSLMVLNVTMCCSILLSTVTPDIALRFVYITSCMLFSCVVFVSVCSIYLEAIVFVSKGTGLK